MNIKIIFIVTVMILSMPVYAQMSSRERDIRIQPQKAQMEVMRLKRQAQMNSNRNGYYSRQMREAQDIQDKAYMQQQKLDRDFGRFYGGIPAPYGSSRSIEIEDDYGNRVDARLYSNGVITADELRGSIGSSGRGQLCTGGGRCLDVRSR